MEPIRKALASLSTNLQQPSEHVSLAKPSGRSLSALQARQVGVLMEQTKARYPSQEIDEQTVEMYGVQWAEMVVKYGMEDFTAGLSRLLRESRFFPDPIDIRESCAAIVRNRHSEESARRAIREHDEMVAAWEASTGRKSVMYPPPKPREDPMAGFKSQAHTREEIEAAIAETKASLNL